MRCQPLPAGIRGVLAAALFSLCLVSCDLGGNDGGPGDSPGILGSVPGGPLPSPISLDNFRASTGFFQEPNSSSSSPSISEDGRFVAFQSYASNLVPFDTNGQSDIFVRDTQTNVTTRVSVNSFGTEGNSASSEPFISPTGRYVVFTSTATNLAGVADTNSQQDIFLHDRTAGTTIRVSIADDDVTQTNNHTFRGTVSRDGNRVAFSSASGNLVAGDTNGTYDIFVRNVAAATTTRVTVEVAGGDVNLLDGNNANSSSYYAGISDDGNFVVYQSYANDLVLGDTNGQPDIFRTNVNTLATVRVSINDDDATQPNSGSYVNYYSGGGNAISADGNFITFSSPANNLVAGDLNGNWDVFVRNVSALTTTLVSRGPGGVQPNAFTFEARISATGNTVCFYSEASTLGPDANFNPDIFVKVGSADPVLVSKSSAGVPGNNYTDYPAMSANGEVVAFMTYSTNLIASDTNNTNDIYIHDRDADDDDALDEPGFVLTARVSEQSAGGNPDGDCTGGFIAPGGPIVVFESVATNLVIGDTNGLSDIFRRDLLNQLTQLISVNTAGGPSDGNSFNPACSADGRFIVFQSDATNLVGTDINGTTDIFVRDTVAGLTFLVSVDSGGLQANGPSINPTISADGRYVAFESDADNLVATDNGFFGDIFLHDRVTGTTIRVSTEAPGDPDASADQDNSNASSQVARISGDGRFVVYHGPADDIVAGDTNGAYDVFVYDRVAGTNTRASVKADGSETPPSGGSGNPSVSNDGRFVAFLTFSPDLVPGDTNANEGDIVVKDMLTGAVEFASVDSNEALPATTPGTFFPRISGNGRYVVFESGASTLVADDTNGFIDVFLRDRVLGTTVRLSISGSTEGNGDSFIPTITDDGKWACYLTSATTLIAGDASSLIDVVIRGPLN